jgi:hypothetical protein
MLDTLRLKVCLFKAAALPMKDPDRFGVITSGEG